MRLRDCKSLRAVRHYHIILILRQYTCYISNIISIAFLYFNIALSNYHPSDWRHPGGHHLIITRPTGVSRAGIITLLPLLNSAAANYRFYDLRAAPVDYIAAANNGDIETEAGK